MLARLAFILLLTFSVELSAQPRETLVEFQMDLMLADSAVSLNHGFSVNNKHYSLQTLKFFVSEPRFFSEGEEIQLLQNSAKLVDFSKQESQEWIWLYPTAQNCDSVSFKVGLSEEINTSGVYGGDLDPTTGMYWTWNTGYIHLKVEGIVQDIESDQFSYHLGGYLAPNAAIEEVGFSLDRNQIHLEFDLLEAIKQLPIDSKLHLMQTGEESSQLLKQLANCIHLSKL